MFLQQICSFFILLIHCYRSEGRQRMTYIKVRKSWTALIIQNSSYKILGADFKAFLLTV